MERMKKKEVKKKGKRKDIEKGKFEGIIKKEKKENQKWWKNLIIILIILALIILITYFSVRTFKIKENLKEFLNHLREKECDEDSDCVLQQITCCSCNMGGEEKCMPLEQAKEWQNKLENCSKDIMCIALYNCKIKACKCVDGKCVEEWIKE